MFFKAKCPKGCWRRYAELLHKGGKIRYMCGSCGHTWHPKETELQTRTALAEAWAEHRRESNGHQGS